MKNVILVPKDKSPLSVLVELGERTSSAWIYLHSNVVKTLYRNCHAYGPAVMHKDLVWHHPNVSIRIGMSFSNVWSPLLCVDSKIISFKNWVDDPDEIIFIKMEEED